jgi:hypothetical protein
MNWPFVSRWKYDKACEQIAQARLELRVALSELEFEKQARRDRIKSLSKAAREISALRKEAEGWREAYCELQGAEIVGVE